MAGFRDLLAETLEIIDEVDVSKAAELLGAGARLLDVREPDEVASGSVAGSMNIPRGLLETTVEARLTDRSEPIVVMCAGGTRSAFAAKTLGDMGYTAVVSLAGGFNAWKDSGQAWGEPDSLTMEQRARYQRHLNLPEIGDAGQLVLLNSKVLLLGAGGLGSPAALYLAAAGVGTLGVVDMDVVDASNLQRQVIHNVDRIGQKKVDSAAETIRKLNPDVDVRTHAVRLDASNVLDLISGYDLIVDGADNFPARYVLNDASVKLGIPIVHGSIFRFEGQVTVFDPRTGPTYRDMLPSPPPPELAPNCAVAGVLGVLPGIIGSIQAVEAIKLLVGLGDPLVGRLLTFDALDMSFSEYALNVDPENPVTYDRRDEIEIVELEGLCAPVMNNAVKLTS
ncbi:MAG: molybdopterin-synthase adenylyltransferase MoeB [Acidimicrobiia bacterium]|nr:molybdopterin-synthase adenylyltransferase MoeB [Acidimicrobiia bacterium]